MIPREKMQEIVDKTDIVELVRSEGIALEKVGKNYRGLCPFHDDSNPSFYVNQEKKIAHCMTCKGGGNPITFIKSMHNCTFDEACLYLAQKLNIELSISNYPKKESKYQKLYNVMQKSQEFYEYYLKNTIKGEEALDYLHKRRLNDETIKSFNIGLSPSKMDILYKTMTNEEDTTMELLEAGMIKKNQTGFYDMFIDRIMFPIKNADGQTIAFSGRVFDKKSDSKYVNSPETVIFHKSEVLYNLHNAKETCRKTKRLVLFEGFMDVIAAYNAGIKEGICSMGTSLTDEQAALISRYTKNVIICYDGDNAGIEATNRAIDILLGKNLNVGIVLLKDNLDPDEYAAKYGDAALAKCFSDEVIDPYGFRYAYFKRKVNFSNYSEIDNFKIKVFEMIYKSKSNVLIEKYFNVLASDLQVSMESIKTDYINYFKPRGNKNTVEISKDKKKSNLKIDSKYKKAECILLHYMLKSEADAFYIEGYFQDILGDLSINPLALELRIMLIQGYYNDHSDFNFEEFKTMISDDLKAFIEEKVLPIKDSDDSISKEEIRDCLNVLEEYKKNKVIEELKRQAENTLDPLEKRRLYSEILEYKKK